MVEKPVTIADEIKKEKESPCPLAQVLSAMDNDLYGQFMEVLTDPKIATAGIGRALDRRDMHVSRHKIQECRFHCDCGAISRLSEKGE